MKMIVGSVLIGMILCVPRLSADPTSGTSTDGADAAGPITKLEEMVMSKLRSDVRAKVSDHKKTSSNTQTVRDQVILTMSFDNRMKRPLEGLHIIACVIGEPYNSSSKEPNKIVITKELPKVKVSPGESGSLVILKGEVVGESRTNTSNNNRNQQANQRNRKTRNSGHRYESYFVVVKDSAGEIIQLKAKDSRAKKFALTNPPTDGAVLGLTADMKFDRHGNRILKK